MPNIHNLVQQRVTSTGTGSIVLGAAITGFATFGAAFQNGDKVYYSIRDGSNRESGCGYYSSGSNSISRDFLFEQIVSGTLDQNPSTPISLTTNAIVSCAPTLQSLIHTAPVWKRVPSTPVSYTNYGAATPGFTEAGSGTGILLPDFTPAADLSIPVSFQIPYDPTPGGSSMKIQLHVLTKGTGAAIARWQLNLMAVAYNGNVLGGATAYNLDAAILGTTDEYQLLEFPSTITISPLMTIMGSLSRLGTHANDTYTGSLLLNGISGAYQSEIMGTPKSIPDYYSWS